MTLKMCIAIISHLLIAVSASAQNLTTENPGWATECLAKDICELSSSILSQNQEVARLSLFNLRGNFVFQINFPPGISLKHGVFSRIDNFPPRPIKIGFCNANECQGTLEFDPDHLYQLKNGHKIAINFVDPNSLEPLSILIELMGFTLAWDTFWQL